MNQNVTPSSYLTSRVDDQITWMEGKSAFNQKWYKQIKRWEIICAAIVPLLIGFHEKSKWIPVIAGIIGAIVVILASMQQLGKYYENWIGYRSTIEKLKREKYLYTSNAGHYFIDEDDAVKRKKAEEKTFSLFVATIENILSAENENWKNSGGQKPSAESK